MRVLVAHCRAPVREGLAGILERKGHQVEKTGHIDEAVRLVSEGIDLLVVGVNFPPSGYAGVLDASAMAPKTIVVGEEGVPVDRGIRQRDSRVGAVLARPYSLDALAESLDAVLGQDQAGR